MQIESHKGGVKSNLSVMWELWSSLSSIVSRERSALIGERHDFFPRPKSHSFICCHAFARLYPRTQSRRKRTISITHEDCAVALCVCVYGSVDARYLCAVYFWKHTRHCARRLRG